MMNIRFEQAVLRYLDKNSTDLWFRALSEVRIAFLPRCMECSRGIAMRILSVRPSVRLSVCQTRAL